MRPGHEINNSPPYNAEVNNKCNHTSNAPVCLHGVDKENVTLCYNNNNNSNNNNKSDMLANAKTVIYL
jgi:hypothetical protein